MVTATLYIEGDGGSRDLAIRFREGWRRFLNAVGVNPRQLKIVPGGGRKGTYSRFAKSVLQDNANRLSFLLVDSETAVADEYSVWEHLHEIDGWQQPVGAEDKAFLMVQIMETWFLADTAALRRYFGSGFNPQALKQWPALEEAPKADVLNFLKHATTGCVPSYSKGKVSFALLAEIDPARVEVASPHAWMLFRSLRRL